MGRLKIISRDQQFEPNKMKDKQFVIAPVLLIFFPVYER